MIGHLQSHWAHMVILPLTPVIISQLQYGFHHESQKVHSHNMTAIIFPSHRKSSSPRCSKELVPHPNSPPPSMNLCVILQGHKRDTGVIEFNS